MVDETLQDDPPQEGAAVIVEPVNEDPETFDREYVTKLRGENAAARTKLREAEERLQAIADKDKSEQQRIQERAEQAEKRAEQAELKLLRAEAASAAGLPSKFAQRLSGSTKDEIFADAKELAEELGERRPSAPRVPRGPQGSGGSSPAGGMDALIRRQAKA